jgi:ribonuclease HI
MTAKSTIDIYTDGACKGNPGPGGWGAYLISGAHEKEIFGGEAETTNNRMELTAVIEALRMLKNPSKIRLFLTGRRRVGKQAIKNL